ncbi:MAG TPA: autotransporter-associated beta strand repeat-containing protein, partial [Prosthecobacter sp.]|nr:autotransporter-associated beta strand repeat-containing protein [Prosthecobacter sp.]
NTYTGTTLVTAGVLQVGAGGAAGTLGGGPVTVNSPGTLVFNRSDSALIIAQPLLGDGRVLQSGSGATTLGAAAAANELTFIMGAGTLSAGADLAINTTSALYFGATAGATTVGNLNLTNGSATAGGLRVQTNTTAVNNLIVGAGKTLTLNGDVVIGISTAPATDTRLTMSGGGSLVVNSPGGVFQVGGATGADNGNRAVLNMSGLASFTANLGAGGVLRVGDNNSNASGSGSAASTLTLPANSTITAGTIGVGDRQGIGTSTATLNLGSGTNILNVDELNVGDRNQRGVGLLQFGGATGTVRIRGTDGVSRTNVNVVSSTAGTGYALAGTVDLAGHNADLYLGVLDIARRTNGTGAGTGVFSFDQGILDVTTVLLGRKLGGTGTATIKGTLNIGGGTVIIGSGGITMAENTTGTASRAEAVLNFTGGAITVGGDILKVGSAAPAIATATLNLTGSATLDMQGHNIGSAAQPLDVLTLASGTLKNVGQINGGSGLVTASTGGLLVLDGNNTYTGGTTVNNGTLRVVGNTGFGALVVNTGGALTGTGLIRGTTTASSGATVSPGGASGGIGALTWDSGLNASFASGSIAEFLLGATPGSSDQLTGTGTITLDSDAMFTVTGWDATYTPSDGDTWRLLDWTSITGAFDVGANLRNSGNGGGDLYLPALDTGYFWDVSNFLTSGTITVVIPEPGRALLFFLGAGALLFRRRRTKAV